MTKRPSQTWDRLAGACLAARDDLRNLVLRIDAAAAAGAPDPNLTAFVRQLAMRHAENLKAALKAPDKPRARQNRRSEASRNAWDVAEPPGGRYRPKHPRRPLGAL